MKKISVFFLILLLAMSIAFAAGAKEQEKDGTITLKIASAMVIENPEGGLEQQLADEFMALHPNVKIEFISTPAVEVSKRIVTLAASNDLPDMFFVPTDFMPQLYSMDIVADLETLLGDEWLRGYNPNLLEDVKMNGKMVMVPWYASPYAVIYRLDWFEDLGLKIPKTWNDFLDVAKKMTRDTSGDGKIDTWAFSMVGARNNSGEQRFILISRSFGADEIYQDAAGNWKSDIDTPEFKKALKYFTDLSTVHEVIPPGPVEVDYAKSMELFTSERTGMILSGPHSLGFITRTNPSLDGKLGSFLIPMDKNHASISGVGGYAIAKTSKHQEMAAEYMKFITNKQNAIWFGQNTGRMPTRKDAAEDDFFSSPLYAGFLEAMDYCIPSKTFPSYPVLLDAIGEAYSTILAGSTNLNAAFARLVDKTKMIIEDQ